MLVEDGEAHILKCAINSKGHVDGPPESPDMVFTLKKVLRDKQEGDSGGKKQGEVCLTVLRNVLCQRLCHNDTSQPVGSTTQIHKIERQKEVKHTSKFLVQHVNEALKFAGVSQLGCR